MTSSCPLLKPSCKKEALSNPPFKIPKCPLEDVLLKCSDSSKSATSTSSKPCLPVDPPIQQKCPLMRSFCPPKPPVNPPSPLLCPLEITPSLLCPLEEKLPSAPCDHTSVLEKNILYRRRPIPPPVCKEISKRCPFDPMPLMCHDFCPCFDVPEVYSGPDCPFAPKDPVCPPICPMMKRPQCPLVRNPPCQMMPSPYPENSCPLKPPQSPESSGTPPKPTPVCVAANANICPSFLKLPIPKQLNRDSCQMEVPPNNNNVFACPFCPPEEEKPVKIQMKDKNEPLFHLPSCPMAKPLCPLHPVPCKESFCPFTPCPCPLTQTMECPIKVPFVPNLKCPPDPQLGNDIDTKTGTRPNVPNTNETGATIKEKNAQSTQNKKCDKENKVQCPLSISSECSLMNQSAKCPLIDLLKNSQEGKENVINSHETASEVSQKKDPRFQNEKEPEIKTENVNSTEADSDTKSSLKCPSNQPVKCPLLRLQCPVSDEKSNQPTCPLAPPGCSGAMQDCPFAPQNDSAGPPRCPFAPPELSPKSPDCALMSLVCPKKNSSGKKNISSETTKLSQSPKNNDRTGAELKLDDSSNKKSSDCRVKPQKCPIAHSQKFLPNMKPPCSVTNCQNFKNTNNSSRSDFGVPSDCPMEVEPCAMFPEGRCQLGQLESCDCPYPVPPCMAPVTCDVEPPEQYCMKKNCCMGLTYPPIAASNNVFRGPFYKYQELLPGREDTKHFVEISDMPFFKSDDADEESSIIKPPRPNWLIIKHGHGYEKCKKVADILSKRGDVDHKGIQYDKSDCIYNEKTSSRIKESILAAKKKAEGGERVCA